MTDNNDKRNKKSVSSNTKYVVLFTTVFVIASYLYRDVAHTYTIGSLLALLAVILADYFQLLSTHHPRTWRFIKFIVIVIILLFTLIGAIG